jgi:hypothetical protein
MYKGGLSMNKKFKKNTINESILKVFLMSESNSGCSNSSNCGGSNDSCSNSGNCECSTKIN